MKPYAGVKEMRRFVAVLFAAVCLSVLTFASVDAAEWEFHDALHMFPDNPDRITVYGTVDCEIQFPPVYEGWVQFCQTVTGVVPDWCNDYLVKFEWAPNDPETCGNIDRWKIGAPGGEPGLWRLDSLAYYIDTYVPTGGVLLPSIGDATGIYRDIYIFVDLVEYLIYYPVTIQGQYWIENGLCPDLPGYLIGTSPIEFRPWDSEPFYTTPFTGYLWLDGEIRLRPGPSSGIDEAGSGTTWGKIKALFD